MTLGAVVLCGGESRRMGQPKAWLPFGSERMLQRVVRLVGSAAGMGPIVVVAAPGQELPPLPDSVTIVRDSVSGRGPLQGLAAGLAALPDSIDLVFATATDVPFLQPSWIDRLAVLIGDHDLAIPFADGYHHPLAALYRRATVLQRGGGSSQARPPAARLPRGRRPDSCHRGRRAAPRGPGLADPPEPEHTRRVQGGALGGVSGIGWLMTDDPGNQN